MSDLEQLPLVTLYLTERCNSRCVTCDYWRHGRKDVTLGPLLVEQVIVTAGLVTGESVITDGAAWLTDGGSVRVVDDDRS